MTNSQNVVDSK